MPRFQPGRSGNPGGRPAGQAAGAAAARRFTVDAVFALARIASDAHAPPALQFRAALALLDRGYGRVKTAKEGQQAGRDRWPGFRPALLELLERHELEHGCGEASGAPAGGEPERGR